MNPLSNDFARRSATLDDVEPIAHLFNDNARRLSAKGTFLPSEFRMLLSSPGFDITDSTHLVFSPDGELVGFAVLFDFEEPHTRIWGFVITAVAQRARGIEEALHAWVLDRARQTVPKAPAGEHVFIAQTVPAKDEGAIRVLASQGYTHDRSYVRMAIDLAGAVPEPVWPDGFAVRTMEPDTDLDGFLRAKADAFSDHHGRGDLSIEQQVEFMRHLTLADPRFDPSLYFLARSVREADEIVGICSCFPSSGIDMNAGHIPAIAIRRNWRRRGIALAMLRHAFLELQQRGKTKVVLNADSQNTTGAMSLYEKAGMHEEDRNLEYRLTIRPAGG